MNDDQTRTGKARRIPHDERLQLMSDERKVKARQREENPPRHTHGADGT